MVSFNCYHKNHHMHCVLGAPRSPFFDVLEIQNALLHFISSCKTHSISVRERASRSPSAE